MHYSVMLKEVIESLQLKDDGIYVDATLGYAGHTREILKRVKRGFIFAFDQDMDAILYSQEKLEQIANNFLIIKSKCVVVSDGNWDENNFINSTIKERAAMHNVLFPFSTHSYISTKKSETILYSHISRTVENTFRAEYLNELLGFLICSLKKSAISGIIYFGSTRAKCFKHSKEVYSSFSWRMSISISAFLSLKQ